MKKDLGVVPAVFPMPVLAVATYGENETVDVMAAAWAMICEPDKIALFLDPRRKTVENILKRGAFTVSIADEAHIKEVDFFGMLSGHNSEDKFTRTHLTAAKSGRVDAPVIEELPVVMECTLAEVVDTEHIYCIVGRIVNTSAEEEVLDENGRIDGAALNALIYDEFRHGYYRTGTKAGQAFSDGKQYMH